MRAVNTSPPAGHQVSRASSPHEYHARGWNLVWREVAAFTTGAFGSLVTREFLTIAVPLLLLWELLPRLGVVPKTLVPPLTTVAASAWDLVQHGHLAQHIVASLKRLAIGLSLALLLAFPLGVLMGWNPYLRKHLLPLFQLLAPIPPPAWVPITIIVLGVGWRMQTFLIFLGAFYPILFNTYQGVKDTDPRYLASARVFGASEWTLIRAVYIPHALGSVVMGIKIGIAMALVMLVIAEMYGTQIGVGRLLSESKEYFRIERMVVCMAILGALGWFLIEIMKYLEAKLALWRVGR
ncbi:MAG TPA: ABC transporter permease [Armatimonadota bacterium]|nr:ABC transporter permease [Armatimonadota bacterium]HOS42749.1 ABC transporter permease [Armatimonadota bacterium]